MSLITAQFSSFDSFVFVIEQEVSDPQRDQTCRSYSAIQPEIQHQSICLICVLVQQ
ncbi:MAG: hypothetical protein NXI28_12470 [bacterium]|nr:hypothetical protein [bacterium]